MARHYPITYAITGSEINLYETTASGCVNEIEFKLNSENRVQFEGQAFGDVFIRQSDTTAQLIDELEHARTFKKVSMSPCPALLENTPENNFEVFWHTFNEHYAFFELYSVNWAETYKKYRPMVDSNTSEEQLAGVFMEMLAPLKGGHISIEGEISGETQEFSPKPEVHWMPVARDWVNLIKSEYINDLTRFANRTASYTTLKNKPNIAYLNIVGMMGEDYDLFEHRNAVAKGMQNFTKLVQSPDIEAVVIDLRFNGGGFDAIALDYASYFLDSERDIFTRSIWHQGQFTDEHSIKVSPKSDTIKKPVYVLVSDHTASAAEIFLFAMRDLPNVTLVGENSSGELSTVLHRHLPNGWRLGLSNQLYVSPQGEKFDSIGIRLQLKSKILKLEKIQCSTGYWKLLSKVSVAL